MARKKTRKGSKADTHANANRNYSRRPHPNCVEYICRALRIESKAEGKETCHIVIFSIDEGPRKGRFLSYKLRFDEKHMAQSTRYLQQLGASTVDRFDNLPQDRRHGVLVGRRKKYRENVIGFRPLFEPIPTSA